MRRNEIPVPLPFIFNLTSDFCGDRCRAITLRFPPEAEFAQSHDAQPLMINCEQLRREQRALSLSSFLSPDWTQTSYYHRVHGSVFMWAVTSSGFLHRAKTATHRSFQQTESWCGRTQKWNSQTWQLFSLVLRFAAFHWQGSGEMSKVIIINVTITIIITLATVQFEPFVLRAFN